MGGGYGTPTVPANESSLVALPESPWLHTDAIYMKAFVMHDRVSQPDFSGIKPGELQCDTRRPCRSLNSTVPSPAPRAPVMPSSAIILLRSLSFSTIGSTLLLQSSTAGNR